MSNQLAGSSSVPLAVFFDRDDTLISDVPYNGDPDLVAPVPGALAALARLRSRGIVTGVITNQSGIGRGLISRGDVRRVNARVDAMLGPFDIWRICPHTPIDGCDCRKPRPGMILSAAAELGIPPQRIAMVGDIGADVDAAEAAGARGVLVPTRLTRDQERDAAALVAESLGDAVTALLEETPAPDPAPARRSLS